MTVFIMNHRENEIEVVLFGQCAANACLEQMQGDTSDEPIVAIVNLARISKNVESKHLLCFLFLMLSILPFFSFLHNKIL